MRTAIAAPSAAPDAVPSTYGSASGFRSSPWNVAPATASPVPTTIAVRTRGSRRSMTIASAVAAQAIPRSRPRSRLARIATVVGRREVHRPEHDPRDEHDERATTTPAIAEPARAPEARAARRCDARRAPAGTGVVVTAVRGRRRQDEVGVDRERERPDALGEPRAGPGDDDVVDGAHGAVLDRGQRLPAGPRGDLLGRHAVGGVAEEDDLGVEREDLLGLDLVDAVGAAGERVAAGDPDHLGAEVVGRRAEEAVGRVELVEARAGV